MGSTLIGQDLLLVEHILFFKELTLNVICGAAGGKMDKTVLLPLKVYTLSFSFCPSKTSDADSIYYI